MPPTIVGVIVVHPPGHTDEEFKETVTGLLQFTVNVDEAVQPLLSHMAWYWVA